MAEDFLTSAQAAAVLGISQPQMRRLIRDKLANDPRVRRPSTRLILIRRDAVESLRNRPGPGNPTFTPKRKTRRSK